MPDAIGFDVYGTLVDPLEMNRHFRLWVGDVADRLAQLWREKQVEYSFRKGLMGRYENFDVCTKQALVFALHSLRLDLPEKEQQRLIQEYLNLRPFPDVAPAVEQLKRRGHKLVAFSNGVEASVRTLLEKSGLLEFLDDIVSVDDLKTFKPDPNVYAYLARRVGRSPHETWLVSSNAWDVIGAKSAGLKAAWINRRNDAVFDPWGIEPDLAAKDLRDFSQKLGDN